MSYNGPRVPLHMQSADVAKAAKAQPNPSYRTNITHESNYKTQGADRPNTHMMSVIRRNPDGTLDFQWAKNMVLDAVHKMAYPNSLLPVDKALITVVFPERFREMEPMQADLMTQFSASEKARIKSMVESQLLEEENWNAGQGGGSVDGRSKYRDGVP
jgi:hypothetical protein